MGPFQQRAAPDQEACGGCKSVMVYGETTPTSSLHEDVAQQTEYEPITPNSPSGLLVMSCDSLPIQVPLNAETVSEKQRNSGRMLRVNRGDGLGGLLVLVLASFAACVLPQEKDWIQAADLDAPSVRSSSGLHIHGQVTNAVDAYPFRLILQDQGVWLLEAGGIQLTCDGVRVRRKASTDAVQWLDLAESLENQAEIELLFGEWAQPGSPWRARPGKPAPWTELQRGWGRPSARIRIDPLETRIEILGKRVSVRLSGYGSEGLPRTLEVERADEPVTTWKVHAVRQLLPEEHFVPDQISIGHGASETGSSSTPIEIAEPGHILVRPLLDGEDLGLFLFDTAASVSCIDHALAEKLGWESITETDVQGVGGRSRATWYRSGQIELAGRVRKSQPIVALNMAELPIQEGLPLAGLLGADWLAATIVTVNPAAGRMEFRSPADPSMDDWPWQPVLVEGGAPCAQFEIAPGRRGWFRLDSGSNDTVTLHANDLAASLYPRRLQFLELPKFRLGGIGGRATARRGVLPWIDIGGRRLTEVPASFIVDSEGPLTNPYLAGTLGGSLLSRFPIAFDLDRRRIAFLPSESPDLTGLATPD